ncbi:hypothetical protein [Phycicoccus sp. Soil803]|uniref:hypothetical protein n=1 Tax=Phycicoccus sp. Soil803 TaxID=1736415 RepID=UPI00070A42E5|nr:hypothetical protein [Phycicoccus sp. Soil803]KRF24378.1 hypothetical protein ASG95_07400 [Phycicoccus sp. Soil803]
MQEQLSLGYWLPRTEFTFHAHLAQRVVTTVSGSFLEPHVAVTLVPTVAPDRDRRQTLQIREGLLENVSIEVDLDDNGVIQGINGQTSSSMSAVISLASKAVSLATMVLWIKRPASLEEEWEASHSGLALCRKQLALKVEGLLKAVADPETPPGDTAMMGTALTTCQSQLAAISEARRAWIAARASSTPEAAASWVLTPRQLLRVRGGLAESLNAPEIPADQEDSARDFGVILALHDPARDKFETPPDADQEDALIIRVARPATVGVYTRDTDNLWVLDRSSVVHLDIVDEFSHYQSISVDQRGWRSRNFKLAFHSDQSVKTFGVGSESALGTIGPALGELIDATSSARKTFAERSTSEQVELERAQTQLDLLKTANEYEVLSATREQAAELAALEQRHKLAELRD